MRRAVIAVAVMAALAAGLVVGSRLRPAEAQRAPTAARVGAACLDTAARQRRDLRRAARVTAEADVRAADALAEAGAKLREAQRVLAREQERLARLEQQLGSPMIICDF